MRDEQHRGVAFPPLALQQLNGGALGAQVHGEQRFVAQQDLRVPCERLGLADQLLLATRHLPDAAVREPGRADLGECGVDLLSAGAAVAEHAVGRGKAHEVARPNRQVRGEHPLLRDVADFSFHLDGAAGQRALPQHRLEEGGLAHAV